MMREELIENELERMDLEPRRRGNYWLIRCPKHEDKKPSAQCFTDGWVHCHAGCGRFHINSVANKKIIDTGFVSEEQYEKKVIEEKIKRGDFTDLWMDLEPLDEDVKGVPAKVLNQLGWRKMEGVQGYYDGVFIPYFDATGRHVPFFQVRHPEGGQRRFTFAKDITPICYGFECMSKMKEYLCFTEGSRDSVILRMAGVPAIALPSASSTKMMEGLIKYAKDRKLIPVAICDKDEAGEMLLKALKTACMPFIDARTSVGKDVGDLYAKNGLKCVVEQYKKYAVQEGLVTR